MNTPGSPQDNWTWRYLPEQLHPDISLQLRYITEECDRDAYIPEEVLEEVDTAPPPEALHDQSGEHQGTQPETLASA
jgi:4-alpha-glucanotransferase